MSIRAVVAVWCLAAPLLGTGTSAHAQATTDQPTFRTVTRLATFDAVVTDDTGRHVTDLSPADIEVKERGQARPVRQVLYVRTTDAAAPGTEGRRAHASTESLCRNGSRRDASWRSSSTTST